MGLSARTLEHLGTLVEIFHQFSKSLDLETALRHATERVKEYLDAEAASLFLLENEGLDLVCRVCSGPINIEGMRLRAEDGIVGRAIREGKIQVIRHAGSDPDFYRAVDNDTGFTTESVLCAPLALEHTKLGALEVLNKKGPDSQFGAEDSRLLALLASSASLAIHNAQMAQELITQERTRKELELACEVQRALLPAAADGNGPVTGISLPARKLSGDFFDFFRLNDDRFAFCVGDVAGKGIHGALLMAKTTSLFRCLGKRISDPGELLAEINAELCEKPALGMFVTMIAGIYDSGAQTAVMANAGHLPPLWSSRGGDFVEYDTRSLPLGIFPSLKFDCFEVSLRGGSLYLFTDGLTECWVGRRRELGLEGVKVRMRRHAGMRGADRLQAVIEDATRWKRENAGYLHDDITLVLIE